MSFGGIMEKRFRDYLRHLEKLDFDVISEEEIWEEREGLQLHLSELHQEMVRLLIPLAALFLGACIFLAAGFSNFFIGNFVLAALSAVLALVFAVKYKHLRDVVKKLLYFVDKLT